VLSGRSSNEIVLRTESDKKRKEKRNQKAENKIPLLGEYRYLQGLEFRETFFTGDSFSSIQYNAFYQISFKIKTGIYIVTSVEQIWDYKCEECYSPKLQILPLI
jgi:hypothetical protein